MVTMLRTKLMTGLAPRLAIPVGLGLRAIAMLGQFGSRIDAIVCENYDGVLVGEGMAVARSARTLAKGDVEHVIDNIPARTGRGGSVRLVGRGRGRVGPECVHSPESAGMPPTRG